MPSQVHRAHLRMRCNPSTLRQRHSCFGAQLDSLKTLHGWIPSCGASKLDICRERSDAGLRPPSHAMFVAAESMPHAAFRDHNWLLIAFQFTMAQVLASRRWR